ncbi:MAG: hypothetical protein F6K39_11290 [Okeania sp. SIO3B3]|nr:hypothetical protein [Okeania sp. SIO3B3]
MNKLLSSLIICTISLGIGKPARAISIFYGEDLGAGGTFVPNGNAVQAQNDFLITADSSGRQIEDYGVRLLGGLAKLFKFHYPSTLTGCCGECFNYCSICNRRKFSLSIYSGGVLQEIILLLYFF